MIGLVGRRFLRRLSGGRQWVGSLGQHDVGGQCKSYDDLRIGEDAPLLLWEKQVHCVLAVLARKKLLSVDEMRRGVEQLPEHVYAESTYYGKWARSILGIMVERGVLDESDVRKHILPEEKPQQREMFKAGDFVRVRKENFKTMYQKPHLRTPGYIFDMVGQVERFVGDFPAPNLVAFRKQGPPLSLYRVRFKQKDIWEHYEGSQHDTVEVEVFQPWLLPATREDFENQSAADVNTDNQHTHSHHSHNQHTHSHHTHTHNQHSHSHHSHTHHDGEEEHIHETRMTVEQNAVDRQGPESLDEQFAQGLINALVEKQVLTRQELRDAIEAAETKGQVSNGAKVVIQAWKDPAFKAALEQDANAALRRIGLEASNPHAATKLVTVFNDDNVHNIIVCTLCSCYPTGLLGPSPSWYKSRSYRSRTVREPRKVLEDFGTHLPDDVSVRVHDSTADCRYFVIPQPPPHWEKYSEEQLVKWISRDLLIGVKRDVFPTN